MSLINQALKKAQRQRTGEPDAAAPVAPGSVPAPAAYQPKPGSSPSAVKWVLLIGGGLGLMVLGAVGFMMFSKTNSAPEPIGPVIAVAPAPAPVAEPIAAVASPAPTPAPAPLPVAATPAVTVELPTFTPTPAPVPAPAIAAIQPAVAAPAPAPVPTPPAAPLTIDDFLDKIRVAGVRISDKDAKVIMNDRIYRLNDVVERTLKLRLKAIEASVLTFVDDKGVEYKKSF